MDFSCRADKTGFPKLVHIIYICTYVHVCMYVLYVMYMYPLQIMIQKHIIKRYVIYATVVNTLLCMYVYMICKSIKVAGYP